jgi:hypothetical protein
MQFGIRQYELAQYPVGMKKHHKITAPEQDQVAWWLACGITIREMARRLGRSPCKDTQLPDTLRSFYSYTKGARIGSEFRTLYVSKRTLFDTRLGSPRTLAALHREKSGIFIKGFPHYGA